MSGGNRAADASASEPAAATWTSAYPPSCRIRRILSVTWSSCPTTSSLHGDADGKDTLAKGAPSDSRIALLLFRMRPLLLNRCTPEVNVGVLRSCLRTSSLGNTVRTAQLQQPPR